MTKFNYLLVLVFSGSILINYIGFDIKESSEIQNHSFLHPDSTAFEAVVKYIVTEGLSFDVDSQLIYLKIDPRIIKNKYIYETVRKECFKKISKGVYSKRVNILNKYEIPVTNIIKDLECLWSGGLQPPVQQEYESPYPERCKEMASFISVIFSAPETVSLSSCNEFTNTIEKNEFKKCVAVNALEITSSSRIHYKIYLVKARNQRWQVIGKEVISESYT